MTVASTKLKIKVKANQLSTRTYSPSVTLKMQGLVAGSLDRWCKEVGYPGCRHAVIEYVFDLPEGTGSVKKLSNAQLSAVLDWMQLERDLLMGSYHDSLDSATPKRELAELCRAAQIQRGQLEMLK